MVFSFIDDFLDREIGQGDKPALATVHSLYSEKKSATIHKTRERNATYRKACHEEKYSKTVTVGEDSVRQIRGLWSDHAQIFMLEHTLEYAFRVGALNFIDMPSLEHLNCIVKLAIKMTSVRRDSVLEEAVKAMNASVSIEEKWNNACWIIRKTKLVRDGTIVNLFKIVVLTWASLAHFDNNGRGVIPAKCLEIVQSSFRFAVDRFLPCDLDVNNSKSEFIHGEIKLVLITIINDIMFLNWTIQLQQHYKKILLITSLVPLKQSVSAWYWWKEKNRCSGMLKCYYYF